MISTREFAYWFGLSFSIVALLLLLFGCTAMMDKGPRTATVVLPGTVVHNYPRALHAFAQLGGDLTATHPPTHLSGRVHNAVVLHVTLEPVTDGTKVQVIGTLLPNKLVLGEFNEVEQYLALLR